MMMLDLTTARGKGSIYGVFYHVLLRIHSYLPKVRWGTKRNNNNKHTEITQILVHALGGRMQRIEVISRGVTLEQAEAAVSVLHNNNNVNMHVV